MKKILFFGANGFIGRNLLPLLKGFEVHVSSSQLLRAKESGPVAELVQEFQPDWILQFSGVLPYGNSTFDLYQGNILPTVQLAEGLRLARRENTPVYLLGSAAELGHTSSRPINETFACMPQTDYGLSKFQQNQFAQLKNAQGYRFSTLRLFNVIGPGMNKSQVPQCFIEQIRAGNNSIQTGPLDSVRDFLDVRDLASTIVKLLELQWNEPLLHLCSRISHRPRELLETLLRLAHCSAAIEEKKDSVIGTYPSVADAGALRKILGAAPAFDLEKTLSEMLEAK